MATYAEQLASVQAAIAEIEGGVQSWARDDRQGTRPQLEVLYARERWLLKQIAREARGGRIRMRFGEPT